VGLAFCKVDVHKSRSAAHTPMHLFIFSFFFRFFILCAFLFFLFQQECRGKELTLISQQQVSVYKHQVMQSILTSRTTCMKSPSSHAHAKAILALVMMEKMAAFLIKPLSS
jgi:hypothetical protein